MMNIDCSRWVAFGLTGHFGNDINSKFSIRQYFVKKYLVVGVDFESESLKNCPTNICRTRYI